ncbi:hypothetical protein [Amycolatopsis samaneae]|uniref:Amino acid permease/ SLC12A domain-containing protein n=1 Tax=Amycolatopsis samaneae TaxID=664691 RepID=A0ABW5GIP8_9PSEU
MFVAGLALINTLMAGRLLYGMANEGIIGRRFGRARPRRRTPWVAIVFTTLIAVGLVSTVDISALGGTTALVLPAVFAAVNVAVLLWALNRTLMRRSREKVA